MVADIGTGDGHAVLSRAMAEPATLVIGVDASADAMAEASRRADRRGPRNAIFLAAGVEALAASPLAGRSSLVTVLFPWGSLLRGVLGLDGEALRGLASVLVQGGRIEVLASVVPSDRVDGMPCLEETAGPGICAAWAAAGLQLEGMRPATSADIDGSGSSWARRLRSGGTQRPVWRLVGSRSTSIGE